MSLIVQSLNWVFISQSCSSGGSRRAKSASLSSRKSVACSTIPGGYRFVGQMEEKDRDSPRSTRRMTDKGPRRRAGVIFRNGKLEEVVLESANCSPARAVWLQIRSSAKVT